MQVHCSGGCRARIAELEAAEAARLKAADTAPSSDEARMQALIKAVGACRLTRLPVPNSTHACRTKLKSESWTRPDHVGNGKKWRAGAVTMTVTMAPSTLC